MRIGVDGVLGGELGGALYLVDCLFERVRSAAVHLEVAQAVVVARVHHGTEHGVLPQVGQTQTALEDAVGGVDLQPTTKCLHHLRLHRIRSGALQQNDYSVLFYEVINCS